MRILALRLKHFQGVAERLVEFRREGITIIQGPNEVGKSSLLQALDLLLEFPDSSQDRRVQRARPVQADVGSEVEAWLEVGRYRVNYFKRYHRERETRATIVDADSGTQAVKVGREAHDFVKELLRRSIDWTLWEALKIQQGTAPEVAAVSLANSVSLREALDRVAGGSGQPADESLFQRVRAEYLRYYTANRRETRLLAELKARVQAARERAERWARRLQAAEQDLALLEHLEARVASSERDLATARTEAEQARAALADLEQQERAQRQYLQGLAAAQAALAEVRRQAEQRQRREAEVVRLKAQLDDVAGRLASLTAEATVAEQTLARLADLRQRARQAYDEVRRRYDLARADVDYLALTRERQRLQERRDRARELQQEIADAAVHVAEVGLSDAQWQTLQSQADRVREARAALKVGSPTVEVRFLGPGRASINGVAQAIEPGLPLRLTADERLTIVLPDLLELTVTPGTSVAELQATREREESRLAQCLAESRVGSMEEAAVRREQRQKWLQQRAAAEKRLQAELGEETLEAWETQLRELHAREAAYLAQRPPDPSPATDLAAARRLADHAYEALQQAEEARRQAEAAHDREAQQREHLRGDIVALEQQQAELAAQVEEVSGALRRERLTLDDAALATDLERAEQAVAALQRQVEGMEQAIAALQPEAVRMRAENADARVARLEQEIAEARQQRAACRGRLETAGGEGLYEERQRAEAELGRAQAELAEVERRAAAARLLYETMEACREEEQRAYRAPLQTRISQLGRVVFGSDFEVELDDNLAVARRSLQGISLPLEMLSTGAREQMALLVRLAVASLVADGEGVPVILDDTLGHTDDRRLELMAAVLNRIGRRCQIIVLTSAPARYNRIGDAAVVDWWAPPPSWVSGA